MHHRWTAVTFLHWPYPPEVVQRLLPPGLEVDRADGTAWVSLVPFRMEDVRLPRLPPRPGPRFPETNVRTYVRDRHGRVGIWFLSLDAARLGAVVTARVAYGLPYFWAAMSVRRDRDRVRCKAGVDPGRPPPAPRSSSRSGPPLTRASLARSTISSPPGSGCTR